MVREWRAERMLRFAEREAQARQWIRLSEIAERYGHERSTAASILNGEFEDRGRSRLLYLHPWSTMAKMTRGKMETLEKVYRDPELLARNYIGCCWIPIDMALRWCSRHQVNTVGWLTGRTVFPSRRGRRIVDDDHAVREMRQLIAEQGISIRQASERVAAKSRGIGTVASTADRLRRKHRKAGKAPGS
jgi:hypothetical protein